GIRRAAAGRAIPPASSGCAHECAAALRLRLLSACLFTSGLSGFLLENLAGVTDTLVLVRIRFLQRSNIRRNLANLLPVNAGNHEARLLINGDIDSRRNRIFNGMRKAQRENDRILLLLRAIAHADDLQLTLETIRHTPHGIRHQSPRQTVKRALRT